MTVKELIVLLQKANPELPVILSKDSEGNDFHAVHSTAELRFVPEKYGRVEIYNPDEAPDGAKPCLVLWP